MDRESVVCSWVARLVCGAAAVVIASGVVEAQEAQESEASGGDEVEASGDEAGLTVSGFVDSYYTWDFDQREASRRPGFLFSHARSQELTVNIAMLRLDWEQERSRATVALMAGTFPEQNNAAEPPMLRSIYEAYGGLRLAEALWLDAGVFASHLGFASALSTQNPVLTRSLLAESSPYYLSGARLGWEPRDDLALVILVANGWQNIRETGDTANKGVGTQVTWAATEALSLNWSSWLSDENPDETSWRVFQDVYAVAEFGDVTLIAGVDVGLETRAEADSSTWWGAAVLGRAMASEWLAFNARVEHFRDPDGVVIVQEAGDGLTLTGASVGVDFILPDGVMLRGEGRVFAADAEVFEGGFDGDSVNTAITTSLAVEFDQQGL